MPEAYEQELEQYKGETKATLDKILAEETAASDAGVARLEKVSAERKPEFERWKQKQAEVEALPPPPKLERPPQAPNTQEMLKPTSLQRTMGMASIFALLSVGIAKGSAIYGLKALGGFMEGAHLGNVEQAEAALKDYNAKMQEVKAANENARQEYLDIFNNKKYTLEMQEHAINLKALEFHDQLMIEQGREKGMAGRHALIKERAKVDFEFAKELRRAEQWEMNIAVQRERIAKMGAGSATGAGETVLGIPMADIPEAPPGQKNEEFLKMLSPAQANIVKRVASGDIDLKTYGGMGKVASENRINYGNAAVLYDPSFKTRMSGILEKAEKELTPGGRVGNNALAINTLPHHVDQYVESFNKLDNSQVQRWNSATNKMQTEFGDPKLGNVQASAYVVAEELARVAKGGTASPVKDEVERFLTIFNTSDSPQQAMGKVWEVLKIAGGRLSAVEESYKLQGMDKRVLTPEARDLILKYKPKNMPTPDWLKARKKNPADLSELEKQAELSDKDKSGIKEGIYPRARNPKTGEVLIFKGGQWQSP